MRTLIIILASLGIQIFLQDHIQAQAVSLKPGDKVRVTISNATISRSSGELTGISNDTLRYKRNDVVTYVSLSSVRKLEVSTGTKRNGGRGAAIGAAAGGLFMGVISMATDESCSPNETDDGWPCMDLFGPGEAFLAGFLGGGVLGAITGGIIGHFTITDRWKNITVQLSAITHSRVEEPPGLSITFRL